MAEEEPIVRYERIERTAVVTMNRPSTATRRTPR